MAFGPGDLVIQNVYGDPTWLQRIFRHTPPCGGFSRSPLLVATLCPKVFQRIVVTTISTQTVCIASALYHYVTMYHRPNVIQNENQHVNIPLQTQKKCMKTTCARYITWFAPTKHSWDEYNLLGLRLVRLLGGVFVRRSMNPSTFVEVAPQASAASELVSAKATPLQWCHIIVSANIL